MAVVAAATVTEDEGEHKLHYILLAAHLRLLYASSATTEHIAALI